jgi:hypothetical protein
MHNERLPRLATALRPPPNNCEAKVPPARSSKRHLGTHVGEQHAAEGAGADAGKFNDLDALQGAAMGVSGVLVMAFLDRVARRWRKATDRGRRKAYRSETSADCRQKLAENLILLQCTKIAVGALYCL